MRVGQTAHDQQQHTGGEMASFEFVEQWELRDRGGLMESATQHGPEDYTTLQAFRFQFHG
jgi:hypothetical protein